MIRNEYTRLMLFCLFAFAGGAVSEQLFTSRIALAAAGEFREFFDQNGRKRIDIGAMSNTALEDFYGEDGKLRLQFGTYTAAGEEGAPFAALSDNNGTIRLLLRLAGASQSPRLIFTDSRGKERLTMGLDAQSGVEEPFLTYTDRNGLHTLFGPESAALQK